MEIVKRLRRSRRSDFICVDSHLCAACWKCVEACPKGVLGKIDLPFHCHVRIKNGASCIGCLKCVRTCPHKAITGVEPGGAKSA